VEAVSDRDGELLRVGLVDRIALDLHALAQAAKRLVKLGADADGALASASSWRLL
jgi:hypothetical protein